MTGRIVIDLFSTLDGVMQAPGGPDEDPSGGFAHGGWQAPLVDETVGAQVLAGIDELDALLLGRWTYDLFASYWPAQLASGSPIARTFDEVPKYVVSHGRPALPWRGSELLGPDLPAELDRLRARHRSVHVIGSLGLARTLVRGGLFDVLNLWLHPVALGPGKRLLPDDGPPLGLTLLEPPAASPSGVVLLRYAPGPPVTTGTMEP